MAIYPKLSDQFAGKNDSWAVRWHASCFLRDMLDLFPETASADIGQDGFRAPTVRVATIPIDVALSGSPVVVGGIPIGETPRQGSIREFS